MLVPGGADGHRTADRRLEHHSAGQRRARRRRDQVRLQADPWGTPVVGLPRRHAGRPRGGLLPDRRGGGLALRPVHRAARRAVRQRDGAAVDRRRRSATWPPTWCRRPNSRTAGARSCGRVDDDGAGLLLVHAVAAGAWPSSRGSTWWSTTPTARPRTSCRHPTGGSAGSTTASPCTSTTSSGRSCGAGPVNGCPIPCIDGLRRLRAGLAKPDSALSQDMSAALTRSEVRALTHRVAALVAKPVFPEPPEHRTPDPVAAAVSEGSGGARGPGGQRARSGVEGTIGHCERGGADASASPGSGSAPGGRRASTRAR